MADFLSRPHTIGKHYVEEAEESGSVTVDLAALERVSLQTLSPRALAESQAKCPQVACHKDGNGPKSAKMGWHKIDDIDIFCEVSKDPRPMVPVELRDIIMQTFHGVGHPAYKETARRISEFYYWPLLKTEVEKFVKSCHSCQSTKPNHVYPKIGKFPLPDKRFQDVHVDVIGPLPTS